MIGLGIIGGTVEEMIQAIKKYTTVAKVFMQ